LIPAHSPFVFVARTTSAMSCRPIAF